MFESNVTLNSIGRPGAGILEKAADALLIRPKRMWSNRSVEIIEIEGSQKGFVIKEKKSGTSHYLSLWNRKSAKSRLAALVATPIYAVATVVFLALLIPGVPLKFLAVAMDSKSRQYRKCIQAFMRVDFLKTQGSELPADFEKIRDLINKRTEETEREMRNIPARMNLEDVDNTSKGFGVIEEQNNKNEERHNKCKTDLKTYEGQLNKLNGLNAEWKKLSDEELRSAEAEYQGAVHTYFPPTERGLEERFLSSGDKIQRLSLILEGVSQDIKTLEAKYNKRLKNNTLLEWDFLYLGRLEDDLAIHQKQKNAVLQQIQEAQELADQGVG